MYSLTEVANGIRRVRRAKRMTQAQLAAAAGVCAQTIALLETESHSPRPATLDRISAALGVTTAELLGQEA